MVTMRFFEISSIFFAIVYLGEATVYADDNLEDIEVDANGYMMFCPCMGKAILLCVFHSNCNCFILQCNTGSV